ncbi:MFS general substrate transporter [Mucidula mucida]|nr:MFS general substrate transporter [Mucidula mucida]
MSVEPEVSLDTIRQSEKDGALNSGTNTDKHVPTHEDFPDGGLRAWSVVVGAMCTTFTTELCLFRYVNSWGVFQAYYQTDILKDTLPSNMCIFLLVLCLCMAWIGSIQYSRVFLPALVSGRLFDLGYFHPLLLVSSALLVTATFLVAECHEYWQFLLCQGFAVGLACGGLMSPTTAVIAHWFKRRRGLAMGVSAMGSSFGGTLIPIAARKLIPKVGYVRVRVLVRRRFPPVTTSGGLFNLRAFRSPAYSFFCASTFTSFLGIYTVLTYIDVSVTAHGVDENFSFYLVSIANASSGLGRYCAGILADRIGPMNVMIPFTTGAAIVTFAWPFAVNKGRIIAIALVYGFASGSSVSLLANPVMEFGDATDVGQRIGMLMSILALGGLAGPPVSGVINTRTGGFEAVGYYAGSAVLVGVGLMLVSRYCGLKGIVYGKF